MTYLFCTLFMQVLALRHFLELVSSMSAGTGSRIARFTCVGIVVAAGLLSAPIILEVADAMAFANGRPVSLGGALRALWFMGAAALIILAVFSYRVASQAKAKAQHFFAIGANVFGILIGLYLAFMVTDQLSFYSSREDTGVLNWALMKEDPSLRDIHCESDLLIVRGFDSGIATYRCPASLQLIYGRLSGAPIVPWPGFTEGRSAALAQILKRIQNGAVRVDEAKHANP